MLRIRVVTAPAVEPVSVDEAREHLRLQVQDDDVYVAGLIQSAREYTEAYCHRAIVTQRVEILLPEFADEIELPRGPVTALKTLKYLNTSNVETTLVNADADPAVTSSLYELDTTTEPNRLLLAYNQVWPDTLTWWSAVRIQYQVGWAADAVPAAMRQALLLLVGQMYEFRVPEITGTIVSKVEFAFTALVAPYRLLEC